MTKLGRYAEAISYFDKSLSKDPNSVGALYNKGKALDDLGRHTEAIDNYNRAHSIDPRYSGQLFNKLLTAEGKSQSTYRSAL
jgi:tetratricopeptide (TPR) repeat protein